VFFPSKLSGARRWVSNHLCEQSIWTLVYCEWREAAGDANPLAARPYVEIALPTQYLHIMRLHVCLRERERVCVSVWACVFGCVCMCVIEFVCVCVIKTVCARMCAWCVRVRGVCERDKRESALARERASGRVRERACVRVYREERERECTRARESEFVCMMKVERARAKASTQPHMPSPLPPQRSHPARLRFDFSILLEHVKIAPTQEFMSVCRT